MRDRITFKCSECGEKLHWNKEINVKSRTLYKFKYCPRCNKKLYKEKKNKRAEEVFLFIEHMKDIQCYVFRVWCR